MKKTTFILKTTNFSKKYAIYVRSTFLIGSENNYFNILNSMIYEAVLFAVGIFIFVDYLLEKHQIKEFAIKVWLIHIIIKK